MSRFEVVMEVAIGNTAPMTDGPVGTLGEFETGLPVSHAVTNSL